MKIIAVINDKTGEVHAVLKGYEHKFLYRGRIVADSIKEIWQFGEFGENVQVKIKWSNLSHVIDNKIIHLFTRRKKNDYIRVRVIFE